MLFRRLNSIFSRLSVLITPLGLPDAREKNTLVQSLDLIITSLPTQFLDIQSPDRLSDHDIVSGTLKIVIPPIKKPRRKVYHYQKGDYESMRSDALKFAKERYFNGYSEIAQFKKIST